MIESPYIKHQNDSSANVILVKESIESVTKMTQLRELVLTPPQWVYDGGMQEWEVVKKVVPCLPALTKLTFDSLRGYTAQSLVDVVKDSTSLVSLVVKGDDLENITGFSRLSGLQELELDDRCLEKADMTELALMKGLTNLVLRSWSHVTPLNYSLLTQIRALTHIHIKFRELPLSICSLTQLTSLDLSYGQVSVIPDSFTALQNLNRLYFFQASLKKFPDPILSLTKLDFLLLSYNPMIKVPSGISRLTNLRTLGLAGISMTVCPPEIGSLNQLTWLALADNWLTIDAATAADDGFPSQLDRLTNLTDLKIFGMNLKRVPPFITRLPQEIAVDLTNNEIWAYNGYDPVVFNKKPKIFAPQVTYIQWMFGWIGGFLPSWKLFKR